MSDTCKICGVSFNNPSFGGPGVCPACDCGYDNKEAQRKEIERLRLQLSRAKEWMQWVHDQSREAMFTMPGSKEGREKRDKILSEINASSAGMLKP